MDRDRWAHFRDRVADLHGPGTLRKQDIPVVRIFCPRGHFIIKVQVWVPGSDISQDPTIAVFPCDAKGLVDLDREQFQTDATVPGNFRTLVSCKRRKCSYKGSFNQGGLAVDLSRAVLDGHTEFHLTD